MKQKLRFLILISVVLLGKSAHAQLFVEHFNFIDSIGAHGWVSHSGSNSPIYTVSGNLEYSSYPTSVGNKAYVLNTGQDYSALISATPVSSDSLYMAMLVNIDSAKVGGDYFFHTFRTGSGSNLNRIYVRKAANGNLTFGILKGSTAANTVWSDSVYSLGVSHLLVLKVKIVPGTTNDIPSLFINPTISAIEPLPTIVATDITSADYADIDRIAIRQGSVSTSPKMSVDEIRVATSWLDALNDSSVPADITVTQIMSPMNSICGNLLDTLKIKVKNISGLTASNVPVKALVTFPDNSTSQLSGTVTSLAVGDSVIVSLASLNTSVSGMYHVKAWSAYAFDSNLLNDTILDYSFTTEAVSSTPFFDDFETAIPSWQFENMSIVPANSHGNLSAALSFNINTANSDASALLAMRFSPIEQHTHLLFNYRIIDEVTNLGIALQSGDSIVVEASIDCQQTFFPVSVISSVNHVVSNQYVKNITSLSAAVGQSPIFRIWAKRTVGNYIIDIDSVEIRNADLKNMAVVSKNLPISKSCGLTNDSIKAIFKNVGDAPVQNIPVSVMISRPYTPPFVTFHDTIHSVLLPGQELVFTFDSTINTSVSGKYTMMIKANLSADTIQTLGHVANNTFIDSVFTYSSLAVPYLENFATISYLNDYTTAFAYQPAGYLYQDINVGFLGSSVDLIHKVGPVSVSHSLFFQYKFTDQSDNAQSMANGDSLSVLVSTDCGATFVPVFTISNSNHLSTNQWVTKQLSLAAFSGQSVLVSFKLKGVTADRRFALDNVIIDGTPSISLSPDTLLKCNGQSALLSPTGSASYQYEWTELSNPTVVLVNTQSLTVTTTGFYKVKATNGVGLSASDSIYVNFRALPSVSLTFPTALSSQCPNGSVIALSGQSPLGGVFSGVGVTSSQFNPLTAGVGTHLITYTFADSVCSNTAVDTIIVTPTTAVSLSLIPDFCLNASPYTLTQGSPANGVYSGSGVSGGIFNPSTTSVGNQIITYTFTDAHNCPFKAVDTLTVKALPNAFAGNNTAICLGDSITLIASGGGSYLWNNNVPSNVIRVSPPVQTSYIVVVTGANSCTNSDTVTVAVKPIPVVQLAAFDTVCLQQSPVVLIGGSATPAGGLGVYSGAGVSNNTFNPMVGLGPHIIRYTYTLNGCSSFAENTIFVMNCTGIVENADSESLTIIPNPVTDKVVVRANSLLGNSSLKVLDITGNLLYSNIVNSSDLELGVEIDLLPFSSGIYFVKILNQQKTYTLKLIKR